jgi:hypothetical protein
MGFSFRHSSNFGPFRLNFSKSGIGALVGVKGARLIRSPKVDAAGRRAYGRLRSLRVPSTLASVLDQIHAQSARVAVDSHELNT